MSGAVPGLSARFSGTLGRFSLDVAFDAPGSGVTALFGPSGCGKTTILRAVAGLERLAGRLVVNGTPWQDSDAGIFRKPHQRPVGYVFQEASLFGHLSVRGNLDYGARRAAPAPGGAALRFDDVVGLLGIGPLLDRAPRALSGGERQRVAIGRTLLSQPRLLLMDEPLAALDRQTKDEILPYLEALHRSLSIPVLYVSHDIAEVERLADTLVLVEAGCIRAVGPLAAIESDPAQPLLRAPDAAVTLDGTISAIDEAFALTSLAVAGGTLTVPGRRGAIGERRRLRIRASDVSFVLTPAPDTTIVNCLPARIVSATPHDSDGAQVDLVAALGADGAGDRIVGRVTRRSCEALGLGVGRPVFAQIKGVALLASGA
jgi:molybdate transport system ATP-binding protein